MAVLVQSFLLRVAFMRMAGWQKTWVPNDLKATTSSSLAAAMQCVQRVPKTAAHSLHHAASQGNQSQPMLMVSQDLKSAEKIMSLHRKRDQQLSR